MEKIWTVAEFLWSEEQLIDDFAVCVSCFIYLFKIKIRLHFCLLKFIILLLLLWRVCKLNLHKQSTGAIWKEFFDITLTAAIICSGLTNHDEKTNYWFRKSSVSVRNNIYVIDSIPPKLNKTYGPNGDVDSQKSPHRGIWTHINI